MIAPEIPVNEQARLSSLHALGILDTEAEERYDRVTRLARRLFSVPVALISLVDANRQWFKSEQGFGSREGPRSTSFCGHAILQDDIFVIPDAAADPRFYDNPLVTNPPHVRFYAGCPLVLGPGIKVGTLCLLDRKRREFTQAEKQLMRDLATMVEDEMRALHLATIDELTQLTNRRGLLALGGYVLADARRTGRPVTLGYFDLSLFKQINDRYGHAEGDRALVSFAQLLKDVFREGDIVSRIGGDEFVVLMNGADEAAGAVYRLGRALELCNRDARRGYDLQFQSGLIAFDPGRHSTFEELLSAADAAMYTAKHNRRPS